MSVGVVDTGYNAPLEFVLASDPDGIRTVKTAVCHRLGGA
jgi:hypothetical protein